MVCHSWHDDDGQIWRNGRIGFLNGDGLVGNYQCQGDGGLTF